MKTHFKTAPGKPQSGHRQRRRGVALLTVLTIISLATILILTFFQLAQNEMVASDSYNSGLEAQQVAEEAVNLVIRQIRMATSGNNNAWASQPGAVRVWDESGDFLAGYKLYSDDDMVAATKDELTDPDYDEMKRWDSEPWRFVDLNEPVIRGEKVYYPIVDPMARLLPRWPKNLGDDVDGVEGFFTAPQDQDKQGLIFLGGGQLPQGQMAAALSEVPSNDDGINWETLPMPAMWVYQLKDGTLGHLDSSKRFRAVSGGETPSEENPIVARFAFWTDDETSKLNPNVHAGGASWATPMAGGDIDRNLGRFQPAQHEWQRYPGHPASVHIAPVLAPGVPDITYNRDHMERIFELVPRVVGGGSMSGTRKVNPDDPREANGLIPDKDRLYASLDEFLLEPGLRGRNPNIREPNIFPDPSKRGGRGRSIRESQELMERSKFFLSVVSRAPEVTVFNTPRVSIWPTHWDKAPQHSEDYHTPFDTLIRFCAEMGESSGGERYKYHFQRYNADSATADYEDIDRNRELFDYLNDLSLRTVPGYGSGFDGKYSSQERRQIFTQIFDYIRSVNLHDDTVYQEDWREAFTDPLQNSTNVYTYTNGRSRTRNERSIHKGHGQVTPISITENAITTKGLGRFYTISEMGIIAIACGDAGTSSDSIRGVGEARVHNPGTTEYRRGYVEDPSPYWKYSNIPPLPNNVARNDPASELKDWPDWLRELIKIEGGVPVKKTDGSFVGKEGLEGEDLLDMAFEPKNWNWQLAWLDTAYEGAMPGAKYNRGAVTKEGSDKMHLKGYGQGEAEQCVQAALIWNMFCPNLGWVPINPDMIVDISVLDGMTFQDSDGGQVEMAWGKRLNEGPLPRQPTEKGWTSNRQQVTWHDRHYGGMKPFTYFMTATSNLGGGNQTEFYDGVPGVGSNGRMSSVDRGFDGARQFNRYPWVTRPFRVNGNINFDGGMVEVKIWSAGTDTVEGMSVETERSAPQSESQLVQQMQIHMDQFSVPAPAIASGRPAYINEFGRLQRGKTGPMEYWSLSRDGANNQSAGRGRLSKVNGHHGGLFSAGDVVQSVAVRHGDYRIAALQPVIEDKGDKRSLYEEHENYGKGRMAHGFTTTPGWRFTGADRNDRDRWLVPTNDGQFRYAGNKTPPLMAFDQSREVQLYGDFDNGMGNSVDGAYINKPDEGNIHSLFRRTDAGALALGMWELARDYGDFPYFVRDWIHESGTPSYFSPNRIISSPGQFGSLPVGTTEPWKDGLTGTPWRTLLFRPNVKGGIYPNDHPGSSEDSSGLPDHLLLDLFWMPVVEPYVISEPLSTGGKVNLNYQILPYHHIKRNTALRGVFKSEYMVCIPNDYVDEYKIGLGRGRGYHWRDNPYGGSLQQKSLRTVVLEDHTLHQFEKKFEDKEIFRTASEICDIHLVPEEIAKRMGSRAARQFLDTTDFSRMDPEAAVTQMANGSYWSDHAAVGDNSRERPYSNIYARITTKSNTFKVHYRAQVLRKAKGTSSDLWDPLVDQVVAEYRGSSVIERYVDPDDPEIPDYASGGSSSNKPTIDLFYKYRVLNPTRFSP